MQITHTVLLEFGFKQDPEQPDRYTYQGIPGRLTTELNAFCFYVFRELVMSMNDLRYLSILIVYQHQAIKVGTTPIPISNSNFSFTDK